MLHFNYNGLTAFIFLDNLSYNMILLSPFKRKCVDILNLKASGLEIASGSRDVWSKRAFSDRIDSDVPEKNLALPSFLILNLLFRHGV